MFPPANLTVPCTSLAIRGSPLFFHAQSFPFDTSLLTLVLSVHRTHFQSSTVKFLYCLAHCQRAMQWLLERYSFFFLMTALSQRFLGPLLTVQILRGVSRSEDRRRSTSQAVVALLVFISLTAREASSSERYLGRPLLVARGLIFSAFLVSCTVDLGTPVWSWVLQRKWQFSR